MRHKLYVIGAGPGSDGQLTRDAREIIAAAGTVAAAPRLRALAGDRTNIIELGAFDETFAKISAALEHGSAAILVSGDSGVYSLLPLVRRRFPPEIIEVIPGISSLQTLCALAKTTWGDAFIMSGHGREVNEVKLLDAADQNKKIIFFCGPEWPPERLCELFSSHSLDVRLTIGERLSAPDQRLSTGTPKELAGEKYDSLSLVLVENPTPWTPPVGRPRDEDFIRGEKIPITNGLVRSAILDALRMERDSILWDLGAGTGSVTVAAALCCTEGHVYAVDRNPDAAELVRRNAEKFHRHNIEIRTGNNAELLPSLPRPSHVFIGGSGAELPRLLTAVSGLGEGIRVAVSAVSFKTFSAASEILAGEGYSGFDAVQVAVSRAKKAGSTFIMAARNPVTVFSAVTAAKEGISG